MNINEKVFIFLILFLVTSCATVNKSSLAFPQFEVSSWKKISLEEFNKPLKLAQDENKEWAQTPELFPQNLMILTELKNYFISHSANSIEFNKRSTLLIIRDGFLDDSVRGDIHRIVLEKHEEKWKVVEAEKAIRCWRNEQSSYSSAPCQ